jgi:hypothetical protein
MIVATFGPTTAWVGRSIRYEDGAFSLDNNGEISADAVMEYDKQGHLVWASDGMRAWVGSLAQSSPNAAAQATATNQESGSATTKMVAVQEPRRRRISALSLAIAGSSLLVVVVVLVLAFSGVIGGKSQPAEMSSQSKLPTTTAPQTASWPTRLGGTWLRTQGQGAPQVTIAESGGQATITFIGLDGYPATYTFTGETLVGINSAPNHVPDGPYRRTTGASQPYTGTYVWNAVGVQGDPVVTRHVTFANDTLTMNQTNDRGMLGLIDRMTYTLSADGRTLTVGFGNPAGSGATVYALQ